MAAIENERQYRITQEQAEKFEAALQRLTNRPPDDGSIDPRFRELEEAALRGQLDDLRAQLAEYEARSAVQHAVLRVVSALRDFGTVINRRNPSR